METPIFVAIISGATSLVVATVLHWLTKVREHEADWRKQKLEHYRELLEALSGIVSGEGNAESQRRYARATNVIGLVASQEVILTVDRMRQASRRHSDWTLEEHDAALASMLLAIRRDLGIRPKDDPLTFKYNLWSSGVPTT